MVEIFLAINAGLCFTQPDLYHLSCRLIYIYTVEPDCSTNYEINTS